MSKYIDPSYDDARKWIQKKREKKTDWDKISVALKNTEEELRTFLNIKENDDDWPAFTNAEWKELVKEMEENEDKQKNIIFKGHEGALFDLEEDNGLKIPENERSCWQLYKNSLDWKPEAVQDLEDATIGILRRLSSNTTKTGPIKGLVIGHVQSGKTANMEALMAMAADHGWNFFVVLSGMIENLRLQTLRRMCKDLNHQGNLIWIGLEHPSKDSSYGNRAQDCNFSPNSQSRYFTVCLKNAARLKKLIDWMHADNNSHRQMKVLVIDDEADQASISNTAAEYYKQEKERKGINKLIVNLVGDKHYKKDKDFGDANVTAMNYVMYTATPYANFLNECTEKSLYPKDFIWTLKTSDEYIGPNEIYGFDDPEKPDGLDIKRIVPDEDLDIIKEIYTGTTIDIPNSLKDAIAWFLCAAANMRCNGYKKPISMLVHTSQKQFCHADIAKGISYWINHNKNDKIIDRCRKVYEYEIKRIPKGEWLKQYPTYGANPTNIPDYLSFETILPAIKELLSENIQHVKLTEEGELKYHSSLHLVIDNCAMNGVQNGDDVVRLIYPDEGTTPYPSPAPAFIIVGGNTLSRGLTIEGLVSTFFLRASCQADTLMQMGRWFGYRKKYELMPRIWMTADTTDKFRFLSELEVDLRRDLQKYMVAGVKPIDYGPRLLCSPKVSWLRITSRNHMMNAMPAEMDFTGARPQTIIFDDDEVIQRENLKITMDFINSIGSAPIKSYDESSLVWKNVDLKCILDKFLLNKFKFCDRSRVFNEMGVFCKWLEQLTAEHQLANWNVVVSGTGKIEDNGKEDQEHWNIGNHTLAKINRSRKEPNGDLDRTIDIGVLRDPQDLLADVEGRFIVGKDDLKKQTVIDEIRKEAGVDKIPMLIIYRINGQSKKRENAFTRMDMNKPFDIIGLQICIPGDQIHKDYCKRLTIMLPSKDKEDEVEEVK